MPSTPRGHRTEAAFQKAAREVFSRQGFFKAKISDIAEAAGKSSASFYNYYESKEALLGVLVDQFPEEVLGRVARLPPGASPQETITASARIYWQTYQDYLPEMIGVFHLSMVDPDFAERWLENRLRGIRGVLDSIRRARKEGAAPGINDELLASAIVSAMEGFCWTWLAMGGDKVKTKVGEEEGVKVLAAIWYRTLYFDHPS